MFLLDSAPYHLNSIDYLENKDKILNMKNIKTSDFGLRKVENVKRIFSIIAVIDHEIFKYKKKINEKNKEINFREQREHFKILQCTEIRLSIEINLRLRDLIKWNKIVVRIR